VQPSFAVFVFTVLAQFGLALLFARGPDWADFFSQAFVGAVAVWWFAAWCRFGVKHRLWLAAVALIPFWGSLLALALIVVIRSRGAPASAAERERTRRD